MSEAKEQQRLRGITFGSLTGFLAMGFGSGLSPKAPGTTGSLSALLLMYPIALMLPIEWQLLGVVVAFGAGVLICSQAAKAIGTHDHGAIVWDEWVGLWAVLVLLPFSLDAWLLAFALFRLFDIAKPWPIGWVDQHLHGGLGIMTDDALAAVFSVLVLLLIGQWWPIEFIWH